MKSLNVGTYWGIPVNIHWTFSFLFLLFLGYGLYLGQDIIALLSIGLFIVSMFVCVIMHEFGHALTARKFGIKTLDIIISPIGGIARLQKLPENPIQELVVAIAGPLVNLGIAFLLTLVAFIFFSEASFISPDDTIELIKTPIGFLVSLIYINGVLFFFNLIPAFPMDGGRILRALLSMRYGKVKGTQIASVVGRILAVAFIILGLAIQSIMLVFIGGFIFIMARRENDQMVIKSKLEVGIAKDIMNINYSKIHLSDTMKYVYDKYIRGGEKNYLVFDSMGNVSGVLPELFIKQAFKSNELDQSANENMSENIYYADENIALDKLFEEMNQNGIAIAIIKNGDQIQGVIDRHMLYNYIQLQLF